MAVSPATPTSLYVHVPFCVRRCSYCDFAVEAVREPPVEAWIEAVGRELAMTAAEQGWSEPVTLDTLYLGGGTPSLLGVGAMRKLQRALSPYAAVDQRTEWTCEANPESFTPELAEDWMSAGVNRLSLGAQTFHAPALTWMGRMHGPEGPARALACARSAGFNNVSLDLIFGLPSRLGRDWSADLDGVLALEPQHVSLYGLTAESATPLGRWVREGRETLADEDDYADEYLLAHDRLTAAGFEHYEVSNFGLPGRHSRHNKVYWTGQPYAALGPGAHGYYPPLRRWNQRSWSTYLNALTAWESPVEGSETVDEETQRLERIWLGLRTSDGLALAELSDAAVTMTRGWVSKGLARYSGGNIMLTAGGWLLLDRLSSELDGVSGESVAMGSPRAIDARETLVQISTNSNFTGR